MRRGRTCGDLLINNGLPLKFNRTSISGRSSVHIHTPSPSPHCGKLSPGSAITEIVMTRDSIGTMYGRRGRGRRAKKKKSRKSFATRIGRKTTFDRRRTFTRFTNLNPVAVAAASCVLYVITIILLYR